MNDFNLEKRRWWLGLETDLKDLLKESLLLVSKTPAWEEKFHDYSFLVFPAAKAYEGYLKTVFWKLKFITDEDYFGKRFRIGKALNPDLEKRYRQKYSVYDKVTDFCGNPNLADRMWETWKSSRNLLFHWFPKEKNAISFSEARESVMKILDTMDATYQVCKIN